MMRAKAKDNKLIYLASPYTHSDPDVQAARAVLATQVAAAIIQRYGHAVFSPITHGHELSRHLPPEIHSHDFWMTQCLPVLTRCDELWVLQVRGWDSSHGVAEEIFTAKVAGMPVRLVPPNLWGYVTLKKETQDVTHF